MIEVIQKLPKLLHTNEYEYVYVNLIIDLTNLIMLYSARPSLSARLDIEGRRMSFSTKNARRQQRKMISKESDQRRDEIKLTTSKTVGGLHVDRKTEDDDLPLRLQSIC